MNYKQKYLKYKLKYLTIKKNLLGGMYDGSEDGSRPKTFEEIAEEELRKGITDEELKEIYKNTHDKKLKEDRSYYFETVKRIIKKIAAEEAKNAEADAKAAVDKAQKAEAEAAKAKAKAEEAIENSFNSPFQKKQNKKKQNEKKPYDSSSDDDDF